MLSVLLPFISICPAHEYTLGPFVPAWSHWGYTVHSSRYPAGHLAHHQSACDGETLPHTEMQEREQCILEQKSMISLYFIKKNHCNLGENTNYFLYKNLAQRNRLQGK